MIASKTPEDVMELIKKEYHIKGERRQDYYLENDYQLKKYYTLSDARSIPRKSLGEYRKKRRAR